MVGQMTSAQEDVRNVYKVGQNTTRLLLAAGDLMVGYLLVRQASVALTRLDANGVSAADRAFYEGKPAVARFFALTVLPELTCSAAGHRVDRQRPHGRARGGLLTAVSTLPERDSLEIVVRVDV